MSLHHPTPGGDPWPLVPLAYIDHPVRVAALQVVEHGRLVEVCQHGHVLNHVELGGVHLLQLIFLHHPCLPEDVGTHQMDPSPHRTPSPPKPTAWVDILAAPCWGQCLLSS